MIKYKFGERSYINVDKLFFQLKRISFVVKAPVCFFSPLLPPQKRFKLNTFYWMCEPRNKDVLKEEIVFWCLKIYFSIFLPIEKCISEKKNMRSKRIQTKDYFLFALGSKNIFCFVLPWHRFVLSTDTQYLRAQVICLWIVFSELRESTEH